MLFDHRSNPETPGGWSLKPIERIILDIGDGGTPSRSDPTNFGGDIAWAVIEDIKKNIKSTRETLTFQGISSCNAKVWPPRSVIVSTGATIGHVGVARVPLATKQGITGIVPNDELIDPDYLATVLENGTSVLERFSQGSTFREIRPPTLIKLRLRVPPKKEQSRIAAVLDTMDESIAKTETVIAKLMQVRAGLLHDILTRGLDEHGQLRPPASDAPRLYKDSPLGWIPKGWDIKSIDEICDVTKLAGYEFTNSIRYLDDGEIIALRALNIKDEVLDLSDIQYISRSVSDSLPRSKIFAGDILITYIGAYIGDVLLITESGKFHLAPNIAKITVKALTTPDFLQWQLRSPVTRRQISQLTVTTATPSLTMTQIRNLTVAIPKDPNEQNRICNYIDEFNSTIQSESQIYIKLNSLKSGLMTDLLTGRVRVPENLDLSGE